MEDSFRVRIDKAFGSLSSSSSSSSSLPMSSSLWCLADEELEKRPWTRESEDQSPVDDDDDEDAFPIDVDRLLSSAKSKIAVDDENPNPNPNPNLSAGDYRLELEDDLHELGDDDDDDDDDAGEGTSGTGPSMSSKPREAVDDEDDEMDVRNSIGMDCALDFEEEEDEYDKVAVGRETTDDCLYMREVTDYTPHLDSYNEMPNSFKEVSGDPRANHLAAKLRLKEDAEAAKNFTSLHVSERTVAVVSDTQSNEEDAEAAGSSNSLIVTEQTMAVVSGAQNNKEDVEAARRFNSLHVSEQTVPVVSDVQNNTSEDGKGLKSILKRKEGQMSDLKSEKRVRFEPDCKDNEERVFGGYQNVASETSSKENTQHENTQHGQVSSQLQDSSVVPDYIRNPSKYTHYTFDSLSDMNEESNRKAYMDFLSMMKSSKQSEPDEVPADLSKPVIFNPKKKTTSNDQSKEITMEEPPSMKSLPVSFASRNRTEDEVSEMEVDTEQETVSMKVGNGKRAARQFRLKQTDESNEPDS